MRLTVHLSVKASAFLEKLSETNEKLYRILREHLLKLPDVYRSDPFLKGEHFKNIRKHRVGDYRILYLVKQRELVILVITIAHRREVYD